MIGKPIFMPSISHPPRRVSSQHQVLFTTDSCSYFYDAKLVCPEGPPYGRELIERNLARLKNNGVDTVLINANAQLPWYPSRVLPNIVTEYKRGDREFFRGQGEAIKLQGDDAVSR